MIKLYEFNMCVNICKQVFISRKSLKSAKRLRQICVRVTERWAQIIDKAIREGLFDSPEEFVTVAMARLAGSS